MLKRLRKEKFMLKEVIVGVVAEVLVSGLFGDMALKLT